MRGQPAFPLVSWKFRPFPSFSAQKFGLNLEVMVIFKALNRPELILGSFPDQVNVILFMSHMFYTFLL